MSVSLDRGTTIGRLRLQAAAADPSALGQRGGSVLGTLDLQPPGMPEQAILCVRRLSDPLPGGLDLRSSAAPRPFAWEAAARQALGEALRRAVRPALGPVPADADAVLFADRAELLACVARDSLRGVLALHWWWRDLLGGERSPAAAVREWMRAPAYVPAAAEQLAAQGELAPFLRVLPSAEAVRLLEMVLRTHALPVLAFEAVQAVTRAVVPFSIVRETAPGAPTPKTSPRPSPIALPSPGRGRPLPLSEAPSTPSVSLLSRRRGGRWERRVGEVRSWGEALSPYWVSLVTDLVAAPLSVEQKTCGILVLLLRRAPALVRSDRFAREIVAWIESERRREAERVESPAPGPALPRTVEAPRRDAVRADIGNSSEAPASTPERPAAKEVEPAPAAPEVLASLAELETPEPPQPDVTIASDFAGVFFLLNAGIALGLYSDFTSPVQNGIDLEIWDFLALTGGVLVDFGDDPIGPLLAALANRKEGEPPGVRFVPPSGQTLLEWLAATIERLRERLALAGIEDPSQVVRRFGRITTTPAHLDVYFSLAAHPIEIRCAGLDRDPGWIPAAGRHVAFHFD